MLLLSFLPKAHVAVGESCRALSKPVHFSFYSPQTLGGINTFVNVWCSSNEAMAVPLRAKSSNFNPL